jgi:hypothetical protein
MTSRKRLDKESNRQASHQEAIISFALWIRRTRTGGETTSFDIFFLAENMLFDFFMVYARSDLCL